ncbi:WG repeat-containing protein [Avibacterium paragallinarum]|uniref:KWG Leptospira n=3 Tax=Avibacterium paragallinarum TaxID=728 RepID=A0AAE5THV1_AVIPA|nr:WG repeat-containing protein [Avibacterium paragallinarum]MEE3608364.1 WG repeat-containing protein [Avibacterium paragallinarum]MEE3622219.1 WG repeat-containing protein [Avibacterium paragallinarum]MEE3669724.1 WG repeat-containing protein [Avibacterium paragallinarum]MEE3680057.1 WG repeat-containing protein [Avibacterium paragallinarum]MEE4385156.1 WG repeat-containing protein [Avibacterium paragallinarum]
MKAYYLIPFVFVLSACSDNDVDECKKVSQNKDINGLADTFCENAALKGDADSQYLLAEILLKKGDIERAKENLEKAANQKHSTALFSLAQLYDKGGKLEENLDTARFYYQKSCYAGEMKACVKVEALEKAEKAEKEREEKRERRERERLAAEAEKRKLQQENARLVEEQKKQAEQQQKLLQEQKKLAESNQQMLQKLSEITQQQQKSSESSVDSQTTVSSPKKFYEGLAAYEENGLWGFVNTQNQIVIPAQFAYAGRFSQGRAAVKSNKNQLWGFIDRSGRYVIAPAYHCLGYFSAEGLAGVYLGGYISNGQCVGGKWGYMDKNGNWVINPVLDDATRFSKGKAKVTYKGHTGFIDRYGNWVREK